ncbi:MAG: Rieske (2Fe-2S) protein [Candidatus Poribacteria bacterium]|nr:Rieske (2Fe-2S) protein [Candidatus Poribacteria bacterium]
MEHQTQNWVKVAELSEVPEGQPKAIQMGEGRSIALFNVDGKIYATDNQCPHMGYPLTRGTVRNGILTCDWHRRSFDLEGGGCFHVECDDLRTFPVEVRGNEIWIEPGDLTYRRAEEHKQLLREGLLSEDRWTMSKAISLLLKGGVPEEEVMGSILEHVSRHIASSHGSEGGGDVSRLINGLKVGRRYTDADRLIAVTTAACSAAGPASERLEVVPLPEPVAWEKISRWVRNFSYEGQSGRIERCLFTAYNKGDADKLCPLLFECAVEPHFIDAPHIPLYVSYLSEVIDEFGWEHASELFFYLGAELVGHRPDDPERYRRDAIQLMQQILPTIEGAALEQTSEFDEDAFVEALTSVNLQRSFEAVQAVLTDGVKLEELITSLVLLAADRMANTPVNVDAGWENLTTELNLAASLRSAQRVGGNEVAAKGIFHVAWQIFADRWINIPARALSQPLNQEKLDAPNEAEGIKHIIDTIETLDVQNVGPQVLGYLNAGYSAERLLEEIGHTVLWDDTGSEVLPTLRTVFEEWKHAEGHPAQPQLLIGLARYVTDIRSNTDNKSAATTAMRFAEGRTTIEVFEE